MKQSSWAQVQISILIPHGLRTIASGLGHIGPDWARLDHTRPSLIKLGQTWPDWVKFGQTGKDIVEFIISTKSRARTTIAG